MMIKYHEDEDKLSSNNGRKPTRLVRSLAATYIPISPTNALVKVEVIEKRWSRLTTISRVRVISLRIMRSYHLIGTQGRTRTGTPVTEVDFESTASTIPPLGPH